jgi:hypothetical protein
VLARVRSRLSFANVTSVLALFVALGGTAYAVNTIGSDDVINDSLLSEDIKQETIAGHDIRPNTIGPGRIADGSLGSQDIKNGSLAGADVANDSLTGSDISEQSLGEVPVAGALRNLDPFRRGTMRYASGASGAEPGSGTSFNIPGVGELHGVCGFDYQASYFFYWVNTTALPQAAWLDEGGDDAKFKHLAASTEGDADRITSTTNTGLDTTGEAITLSIHFQSLALTIWAFGRRFSADNPCSFAYTAMWADHP